MHIIYILPTAAYVYGYQAYKGGAEYLQQRPYGSQSLKYLLSCPLPKREVTLLTSVKTCYSFLPEKILCRLIWLKHNAH